MAMSNHNEALAATATAAIRAVHAPGASPQQLLEARQLFEQLRGQEAAHEVAFRLTSQEEPAEVQHFGFQLLLARVRASGASAGGVLGSQERSQTKAWLISLLPSERWGLPSSPPFVRGKCSEVVAELARLDFPSSWPELQPALLAAGAASAGAALLALNVWSQVADLLAQDSKDLTVPRRRELAASLIKLVEQPSHAPELVAFLQHVLQKHGGDRQIVREALSLCRALASAVPIRLLLQHQLDKIVHVGLQAADLRELAVAALADWVDCLYPSKKGGGKSGAAAVAPPATHDLCRFTTMVAQLAGTCAFDAEDPQSYSFHRQVGELLCDLCANNANELCQVMPCAELSAVWQALLHMLRYPSFSVQLDASQGMVALARGQAGGWTRDQGSPPRPPLEELVGVLSVLCLRLETLPGMSEGGTSDERLRGMAQLMSPERSAWLLRCLGKVSAKQAVGNFSDWCQMLALSHDFEALEGEVGGGQERGKLFGVLKTRCRELLMDICKPQSGQGPASPEGFGALCRCCGSLVARALAGDSSAQGGWAAEFDAAVALLEGCAASALRLAEKQDNAELLRAVLQPSHDFLKQVSVQAAAFSPTLEHRRLEFLSGWGNFYRHFGEEVLGQVLQQVLVRIREAPPASAEKGVVHLQARALDTLIGISKCGVLQANRLEALHTECQSLASQLPSPQARGKLVEALAAAVASCPTLARHRQEEIVCNIMEQATTSWLSNDLVQSAQPQALLACLVAAARAGQVSAEEPNRAKLRDLRTLLMTFTAVVTRTSSASSKSSSVGDCKMEDAEERPLASKVVAAWAPGIFAFLHMLSGLCTQAVASRDEAAQALVLLPARSEHESMLGRSCLAEDEEEQEEQLQDSLDAKQVRAVRSMLWELRCNAAKAARSCVVCASFWELPPACSWLQALAESLPGLRPHVADLLLREVFSPALGRNGPGPAGDAQVEKLCGTVVAPLVQSLGVLLRDCWSLDRQVSGDSASGLAAAAAAKAAAAAAAKAPPALPVPPVLEPAFATSAISLTRSAAHLLAALAGSELPQAGLLADPERRLFQARSPQAPPVPVARKKKQRNKNRFAALADDAGGGAQPSGAAAEKEDGDLPTEPKGCVGAIMQNQEVREALRTALVELLRLPEKEAITRALVGLAVWSAQLWNMIARGEDPAARAAGATPGCLPQAGELLHAASDALRSVPGGVVKPAAGLAVRKGDESLPEKLCSCMDASVRRAWSSFVAPSWTNGKRGPSTVVCESTHAVYTALAVLLRLFKLQCRKLDLRAEPAQLYLCPPLAEALQICRQLPNTCQDDVDVLFATLLDHEQVGITQDMQRGAVRALLHEASPAFGDAAEADNSG